VIVFINGNLLPEAQATVSVFDRSFLYGDGLFETLRVVNGKPFRWWDHMERLRKGGDFLGIKIPFGCKSLEKSAIDLIAQNKMPDALLRITVSRGVGLRGYSPKGADKPTLVMTLHAAPATPDAAPACWKLHTASLRLPAGDPLACFKTANKLAQVLARAEADAAGADEALLLNTDGHIVEGASSNLFWIEGRTVLTPPLTEGLLAGVTRSATIEMCRRLSYPFAERFVTPEQLRRADGVFLTLSSYGVVEAIALDGESLSRSSVVAAMRHEYERLLNEPECDGKNVAGK
jgi:branched-chain amino acid aminotransferase